MLTALRDLYFAPFTFELEAETGVCLPRYKGSVWRGALGHALKRATCMTRTYDCPPCLLKKQCGYYRLFETKADAATSKALVIGGDAPRPYVLVPPLAGKSRFAPGERFAFGLVLVGEMIDALPFFIHTFEILGGRFGLGRGRREGTGRFRVARVADHAGRTVYQEGGMLSGQAGEVMRALSFASTSNGEDHLRLRFLTPTRVRTKFRRKKRGLIRPRTGDDFLALVDSLYHRLFMLTQLYCREAGAAVVPYEPLRLDGPGPLLLNSTIRWYDWERYSRRQEERMKLGGFVGEVTFCGEVGRYVPLFRLGSPLHIGSGTTFGLGKLEVEERDE